MIRILIADDSATARSLLAAVLGSDPELQVVGEAVNGLEAVALTRKLRPDVVTMDIHMPIMDGFVATKEIMTEAPTPIVIVTSSPTVHHVEMSMQALQAGALAILAKPAGPGQAGFDEAAQQLIVHVKAMAGVKVVRHWRSNRPVVPVEPAAADRLAPARLIAVAASTGGPMALHTLLSGLPAGFPVPVLVVQHITHGFVKGLADWLDKAGDLKVQVAQHKEPLQPRNVYLAPDDYQLGVSAPNQIMLSAAPPIGGFRPSGTFLFESVAKVFAAASVAVILTGMGDDGVAGLRAVRKAGGRIIAQDEKSSVVWGMPGVAVAAGLADEVLPLEEIAARLSQVGHIE